jgi:hypothetical protein
MTKYLQKPTNEIEIIMPKQSISEIEDMTN